MSTQPMRRNRYFMRRQLLTSLLVILPLVLLGLYSQYQQAMTERVRARQNVQATAKQVAFQVEDALLRVDRLVQYVVSRPDIQLPNAINCQLSTDGLPRVHDFISYVAVFSKDGVPACGADAKAGVLPRQASPEWFSQALMADGVYLSRAFVNSANGSLQIKMTRPIKDADGNTTSLVVAAIDVERLTDLLLGRASMEDGGIISLISPDGTIIARTPDLRRYVGKKVRDESIAASIEASSEAFEVSSADNVRRVVAIVDIQPYRVVVAAGLPTALIDAGQRAALIKGVAGVLFACLLAFLTAIYVARMLSAPLQSLTDSVRAYTEGDQHARADDSLPGEFARLAREFNRMIDVQAAANAARDAQAAAEAANRAKTQFLAHISHEIRTPMNAVLGFTNLALRTQLTSRQNSYLSKTRQAAESLMVLINQLLDLSRIESGKLYLDLKPMSIDDVLEQAILMTAQSANEKGVELLCRMPQSPLPLLVGDAQRLTQVLINLIGNAIKFTERGEVTINIDAGEQEGPQQVLRFEVRDTGVGMSADALSRVFEPFEQADTSTTRVYGGSGLGLAISRQLVELMGGRLVGASNLGEGSSFTFDLTLPQAAADSQLPQTDTSALGELVVLVVDKSVAVHEVYKQQLLRLGCRYQLESQADGAWSALQTRADEAPFDVVLLEMGKDGLQGKALVERIRAQDSIKTPRIIALVNHGDEAAAQTSRDLELSACLYKPVRPKALVEALLSAGGELRRLAPPDSLGSSATLAAIERLRGRRVLLVEDNEFNQLVASELLREAAHMKVSIVGNGEAALQMLTHHAFDLVLMDIQMPGMDGHETTRKVRSNTDLAELPVIAMTAYASVRDRELCLQSGMNDHVIKPFDPSALLQTLAHWVDGVTPQKGGNTHA